MQVFLKVADVYFNGVENLDKGKFHGKFLGQLYGLGGNQTGIYRLSAEGDLVDILDHHSYSLSTARLYFMVYCVVVSRGTTQ